MTDAIIHHRPRRRRGRRLLAVFAILSCLGLAGWSIYQLASGRTDPPRFTREAADKARAELRKAKGDRWAPAVTKEAERQYREAAYEVTRQDATNFLFRNYDDARRLLEQAEQTLKRATRVAVSERADQRQRAESAIQRAREVVEGTGSASRSVHLGNYEQRMLNKSELAVAEAALLFESEDYAAAERQAELAGLHAGRVSDGVVKAAARFVDPASVRKWRDMINDTVAWSRKSGAAAIVVSKESHTLTLYRAGRAVKTWRVELGYNSVRDKTHAGDNATPEGRYRITAKKGNGASRYHKALLLNYPNDEDRAEFARLRRAGHVPRGVSAGNLIEIHGDGGRGRDWTNGCVALTNREIDELFQKVGVGTPVTIVGSDGSGGTFSDLVRSRRIASGTRTD